MAKPQIEAALAAAKPLPGPALPAPRPPIVDATQATSVTHQQKYAVFSRQLSNPAKFRDELDAELKKPFGKRDLFRVWLQNGETLDSCVMYFKKRSITRTKSEVSMAYKKRRDLESMYAGKENLKDFLDGLIADLTKNGKYLCDPLCPRDVEERSYLVRVDVKLKLQGIEDDETGFEGKKDVDCEAWQDALQAGLKPQKPELDDLLQIDENFIAAVDPGKPKGKGAKNKKGGEDTVLNLRAAFV